MILQLQERLAAYGDRERELQRKLMEAELKLEQQVRRSHWIMRCMLVDETHPSWDRPRMIPTSSHVHFPPRFRVTTTPRMPRKMVWLDV